MKLISCFVNYVHLIFVIDGQDYRFGFSKTKFEGPFIHITELRSSSEAINNEI